MNWKWLDFEGSPADLSAEREGALVFAWGSVFRYGEAHPYGLRQVCRHIKGGLLQDRVGIIA